MKNKLFAALLVGLLLIGLVTACNSSSDSSSDVTSGDTAQSNDTGDKSSDSKDISTLSLGDITATDINGTEVSGNEFKGEKLTVLNVWATWCPPCVEELPHLQEISEEYKDKGVAVVGVLQDGVDASLNADDTAIKEGQQIIADAGASYTIILPEKTLNDNLIATMQYFPTTFFIDSDGNIVNTVVGAKDSDGWRSEIDAALKELK